MTANFSRPFEGQRAVVTGARTGIGLACAQRLAQGGADVTLWGHRDLEEAAVSVAAFGGKVDVVLSDLSDPLNARAQAERMGDVDILVNNAGIIHREPAAAHAPDAWRRVLSVNLDTIWHLSQVFGVGMIGRGYGRVVSIASLLSFQGGINVPSYTASKHAVVGLTKALANEWATNGVTVNAVAPGYISTNNTEALRNDANRERAIRERIPAGRWGNPQDIAGAVAFLAGPEAGYVNGHTLVVDGGWMGR
ncbi:2-deoxy-D-gluconate 3-dehydrogenase [Arthrobacter subterraneus]|uniref:2-deoxy-D-gluconate 3-dehydrogenase n=1 Tax=Arthrobacter subterraneus TaxID=335973 RepID=A0A1G8K9S3_9MICC|nr:SDR family oxidoreductase [Arthrobacter subterraneus]SDI40171.1 2-deoxy-D-gluconate 3-dehydrogenase [Arthrobacter subterraneus]